MRRMSGVMLMVWLKAAARGHFLVRGFNLLFEIVAGVLLRWFMAERKNSFLPRQEWCDGEGETRKTKCLAVFEEWLTAEEPVMLTAKVFFSPQTLCLHTDAVQLWERSVVRGENIVDGTSTGFESGSNYLSSNWASGPKRLFNNLSEQFK